jgi:toxin ParE1/3/4
MDYAVIVTARARRDLQQILNYIGRDDIRVAQKITHDLVHQTNRLVEFPRLGRIVPEINEEHARELIYRRYRIVYRIVTAKRPSISRGFGTRREELLPSNNFI